MMNNGTVDVWKIEIETLAASIDYFYSLLSVDETQRAQRFHFDKDKHCYIVARGGLRALCAHYLGSNAKQIRFGQNAYGKPLLLKHKTERIPNLQFNVSHSGGYIVIALTCGMPLGIDIEQIKHDIGILDIAKGFFSAAEYAELIAQPVIEQRMIFFQIWTRKEAYIKAEGKGFSIPLDSFVVPVKNRTQFVMFNTGEGNYSGSRWSIYDLNLPQAYVGALAIESNSCELTYFDLDELLSLR